MGSIHWGANHRVKNQKGMKVKELTKLGTAKVGMGETKKAFKVAGTESYTRTPKKQTNKLQRNRRVREF